MLKRVAEVHRIGKNESGKIIPKKRMAKETQKQIKESSDIHSYIAQSVADGKQLTLD